MSHRRKKGLQPQPQTCAVNKDQCPARRAWCLQASPCSTAPCPFTFRMLGRQSTMMKCWLETIIGQSTRFVLVCLPCNLKLFVLQTRSLKDSASWPSQFERKSAQLNGDWTSHSHRLTVVRDAAVMRPWCSRTWISGLWMLRRSAMGAHCQQHPGEMTDLSFFPSSRRPTESLTRTNSNMSSETVAPDGHRLAFFCPPPHRCRWQHPVALHLRACSSQFCSFDQHCLRLLSLCSKWIKV